VLVVSGRQEELGRRFVSVLRLAAVGVGRGGLWLLDGLLPCAALVLA
jgi:hypothetical protein